jgi:PAS domain S-box-containing protein
MAYAKPFLVEVSADQVSPNSSSEHCTCVQPDYVTVVNAKRKFVEISSSFCQLLGYTEEEILGRIFDDFTVPRTINIPTVWRIFVGAERMVGIWVFAHRSGTKLFVRYEASTRADGLHETHMELLGAGA